VGATVVAGAHLGSIVVAGGATGFTVTRVTRPALSTMV
jgi:membrane-associated phospholipid phosphatase